MRQQRPGSLQPGPLLDFQTLKRQISIERVLHHVGVLHTLKHTRATLTGPCPIHGGDNPRAFVVSKEKNLWRCFTRCEGGDVIELVKALHRCSYREVAHRLSEMIQPGPPKLPRRPPPTEAFKPFTRRLHLEPEHEFLQAKRIRSNTAAQFEVGYYQGRGFLSRSIAVRLHDPNAAPLGYAARHLDPRDITTHGKWKFPPRLPKASLLYNLHRLKIPHKALVVVECPWGVLRLHQLAIPSLALLGTRLSHQQRDLLRPFPRIVLMMDADEAGRRAARRLAERLRGQHELSIAAVPEGLDPDQLEDPQLVEILRPFFSSCTFSNTGTID